MTAFHRMLSISAVLAALAVASLTAQSTQGGQQGSDSQGFRFRTGVDLVNVTATVTDASGRFVPGLTKDDFRVFDDDQPQSISHFSSERVPVSLGIVLDTSASMDGEKMSSARDALDRFLFQLLDQDDEVFLYRFDNEPELIEGWTKDKRRISQSLGRIQPRGGTALYDTVAEAVQLAQRGHNRKKAVVIISDGNDTNSHIDVLSLKRLIRQTEVLVYAVGIDGPGLPTYASYGGGQRPRQPPRVPVPFPFPFPPGGRRPVPQPPQGPSGGNPRWHNPSEDRVNVAALRDITDDSGGRTEIIRQPRDLDPATAGIADELSKQYYLGYAAGADDGKWHTIRVEVRQPSYHVRARRGYIAGK